MVSYFKEAIQAYRVAQKKYIMDKSGEGAQISGGRWTPPGCAVLHFSESISLCVLEASVPLPTKYIKKGLSQIEITLPKGLKYESVELKALKKGWKGFENYQYCREFGTKWYKEKKASVLRVPSAIVETEYNYILNPSHKDYKLIKFGKAKILELNLKGV